MVSVSSDDKDLRPHQPDGPPRGLAPLRLGVLELAVFFGAFWLIETYYATPSSLLDFRPHLFWIPVLLLTLQYGVLDGIFAAAAAILAVYMTGWPEQEIGEDYFSFWLRAWLEPSLWVGTALILGEIRQSQIMERAQLESDLAHAQRKAQVFAETSRELRAKIERLERRIAGGGLIPPEACLAIIDLHSATADDFAERLTRNVRAVLGEVDYALRIGGGRSHLSLDSGWNKTINAWPMPKEMEAVVNALADRGRVLGIHNPEDGCLETINAIFAGAVVSPATGRAVGLLSIGKMNGEAATDDIEAHLALLCRTVSVVACGLWPEIAVPFRNASERAEAAADAPLGTDAAMVADQERTGAASAP